MTFIQMYNDLKTLGVEVEWIVQDESFKAIVSCSEIVVSKVGDGNVPENFKYTVTGGTSQYPAEYLVVDEAYASISTEWVVSSGTKYVNVLPAKDGAVNVPFSDIGIGNFFYHGGVCLKVSESQYFNSRIISIKTDTPVTLSIATVQHYPFVI